MPEISLSGKKKPSKRKKSGWNVSSAFELLDREGIDNDDSSKEEDDYVVVTSALLKEEIDDGASVAKDGGDLGEGGVGDQEEDVFAVKISGKIKVVKKEEC